MRFRIHETNSGATVFDSSVGETFKSRHSAQEESEVVFYGPGIQEHPDFGKRTLDILELGFGLGTNFLHLAQKENPVRYLGIEQDFSGVRYYLENFPHPFLQEFVEEKILQNPFPARLVEGNFFQVLPDLREEFDCVYFDPFSPKSNPECWNDELFRLVFNRLRPGGRLVTYSVSRIAKTSALNAGFQLEKRDLPAGLQKRSSLLAIKPATL